MMRSVAATALAVGLSLAIVVTAQAADVEKGKMLFEKCAACHSLEAGKNDEAPTLAGIFGRKIASIEDFRYSAAMKRSDVVWLQQSLGAFIEDPQSFVPGNRMPFDGLKEKSEREDLLAYLELATKTAAHRGVNELTGIKSEKIKKATDYTDYADFNPDLNLCNLCNPRLTQSSRVLRNAAIRNK